MTELSETVVIECDGREFGWLAFAAAENSDYEAGPTVTVLHDDDPIARVGVAFELQRFLSALAFEYQVPIETVTYGSPGSGEPTLTHPAGHQAPNAYAGKMVHPAPARIETIDDDRLRLALALLREGLSTTSPFLSFLGCWNVVEAVFDGNEPLRDQFLRTRGPGVLARYSVERELPDGDAAKYLIRSARNPLAHAIRKRPDMKHLNPDDPTDRVQLQTDTRWMLDLARIAIESRWADPVRVTPRD